MLSGYCVTGKQVLSGYRWRSCMAVARSLYTTPLWRAIADDFSIPIWTAWITKDIDTPGWAQKVLTR